MRRDYLRISVFLFAALALVATWNTPGFSATLNGDGSGQFLLAQAAAPRAAAKKARTPAAKRRAAAAKRRAAPKPAPPVDNPIHKAPHAPGVQHG
jgi:hypothetical protein